MLRAFNAINIIRNSCHHRFCIKVEIFQRFWVLEEMARAPYFTFLSVLHFRESMGLRGPDHIYLMNILAKHLTKQNILNIWKVRCNAYWIDRAFCQNLVLIYYWIMVVYYGLFPVSAYDLNERVIGTLLIHMRNT